MALLTYNNITLPYPMFTTCRQEAVGDELSNTDWIGTKFSITTQTVVNAAYLSLLAPDLIGVSSNVSDIMQVVRNRLLQRRKRLSLKVSGNEVIPQIQSNNGVPISGTVDTRNGPIPLSCEITHLTASTFLITFTIEAQYWLNTKIVANGNPVIQNAIGADVLYNRWTETVDMDDLQYSTYTRDGKYMIRSDNADGLTADKLRTKMTMLAMRPGFLRTQSHYQIDPNGLGMAYRITDRQQFKMPPPPALKAEGTYSEIGSGSSQVRWGDCLVKLEGGANTSQADLVNVALAVVSKKLLIRGVQSAQGVPNSLGILRHSSIRVGMYSNWAEVHLVAQLAPLSTRDGKGRYGGGAGLAAGVGLAGTVGIVATNGGTVAGLRLANFTTTPLSDDINAYVPEFPTRGTADLFLQAAAYYDPNVNQKINSITRNWEQGIQPGQAGVLPGG